MLKLQNINSTPVVRDTISLSQIYRDNINLMQSLEHCDIILPLSNNAIYIMEI